MLTQEVPVLPLVPSIDQSPVDATILAIVAAACCVPGMCIMHSLDTLVGRCRDTFALEVALA